MLDDTEVNGASRTSSVSAQPAQAADATINTSVCTADVQAGARREILRHIFAHTAPAQLPIAWSFLAAKGSHRTLHCDPSELVASLQRTFSVAELQAARVLVPGPENEPQLVPMLRDRLVQVLVDADGEPIDLAGDSGALFGADPPCFDYARQRRAGAGRPKRVFVAAMEDLPVFECLGLPCRPVGGLAHLDGQQVRRLYANLSPTARPRCRLTLVGASIANLENELPSYLEPILNRLHDVENLYGHDEYNDSFQVWRPSVEDFNQLRAAVTFADRQMIRRAIRDCVDVSAVSAGNAWRQLHEPDLNDLESAHAALIRTITTPGPYGFGNDLRTATTRLSTAINRLTTRRFVQAADAASTPQESFALLTMAEIIQHLNQSHGLVKAAKSRDAFSLHYDPTLTEERLEEIERCTKLLQKIERLWPQK